MNRKIHSNIRQLDILGLLLFGISSTLVFIDDSNNQVFGIGNTSLEAIIGILSIPLIFQAYFPKRLHRLLNFYSCFAITYSLPFFFTFTYLSNPSTKLWSLGILAAFVILANCVNFQKLWPMIFSGCFIAVIMSDTTTLKEGLPEDVFVVALTCFSIVLYFSYIASKMRREHKEAMDIMQNVGAIIAHELRTSLASIKSGVIGIENNLPTLLDSYQIAQNHNLKIGSINPRTLSTLKKTVDNLPTTCAKANTTINIFLNNLREPEINELYPCKANTIIREAIAAYPMSKEERNTISCNFSHDFEFLGNSNMMRHVVFNLLKNALVYLKGTDQDNISISTISTKGQNKIVFRDNGKGINYSVLPYIFDRFFSSDKSKGYGLGLYFCKTCIEQFGGKIECKSIQGEYTEFTINLPTS